MHQNYDHIDDSIQDILERHHIPYQHRADFNRLIEDGVIESPVFANKLRTLPNYEAACQEIMELLSRPFYPLTVPNPPRFESLNLADFLP
jgi:hypothetical protein